MGVSRKEIENRKKFTQWLNDNPEFVQEHRGNLAIVVNGKPVRLGMDSFLLDQIGKRTYSKSGYIVKKIKFPK